MNKHNSNEKMTQFLLRIEPSILERIENIAPNRKISEEIRTILRNWLDENHPDVSAIGRKILFYEKEIARLQGAILNVDNIRTTQQQEFQDMDQFRDKQENTIMYMLYVQYVSQMADDIDHNKWMKTLKFDKKDEMLDYLNQKWEEYGQDTVRHYQHKQSFITTRMNEIKLIAKGRLMEVEEYMAEKNIDLDAEYEAGKIRGSMKDFK